MKLFLVLKLRICPMQPSIGLFEKIYAITNTKNVGVPTSLFISPVI